MKPTKVRYPFIPFFCAFILLCTLTSCSSYNKVDHLVYKRQAITTAILNVNILSQDGETMIPQQNVIIERGKISRITGENVALDAIKVIDGAGKYLIPGLVDSHVHMDKSPNDLLVFAAHGITHVREMSGTTQQLAWNDEIKLGRIGPKIDTFSEKISSKSGVWGAFNSLFWKRINISSTAQAQELADKLIKEGYRGAKISSDINKPMYLAITQAAKQKGLPVAGHIPSSITFDELLLSGQNELAHIEEIVKALNNEFGGYYSQNAGQFLDFVEKRSDEIAKRLKQQHISVGTTLWYMETTPKQVLELQTIINSLDLSYGNPARVADWYPGKNKFEASDEVKNNPETAQKVQKWWNTFVDAIHIVFKSLLEHKVIMLAGTDSMAPLVIPGISLHLELESLVNAGMTTAQALQSATSVAGEWMKTNTGKIAVGYDADLLLLSDNPLQDIRNTRRIEAVILSGKVLDEITINNMLQRVREAYQH